MIYNSSTINFNNSDIHNDNGLIELYSATASKNRCRSLDFIDSKISDNKLYSL